MSDDLKSFNDLARNERKSFDEFVGLAKGILADDVLADSEIKCLKRWIIANPAVSDCYPIDELSEAISRVYSDNITEKDRSTIFNILNKVVGGEETEDKNHSSILPLDDPQPKVVIKDHVFCLTGIFTFGPKSIIKQRIEELGGLVTYNVTEELDYLVIGDLSSRDWIHTSYGSRIESAIEYREKNNKPRILSEETIVKLF